MSESGLFVDDDADLLETAAGVLRAAGFTVETAPGPLEALERAAEQSFAVVVSDMSMPVMDGIRLLGILRERSPITIRVLITGVGDYPKAIDAINEGHVFRFLTKPCSETRLKETVRASLTHYRLVMAEKELLDKTFGATLAVLGDVLAIVNPAAFGRAARVRRLVIDVCEAQGVDVNWEILTAITLSQIGCVTVPEAVLESVLKAGSLSSSDMAMFDRHPEVGYRLLKDIPRLEGVAAITKYQGKRYDGGGRPRDDVRGEAVPWGARLLKLLFDFDILASSGLPPEPAIAELKSRAGWYDPALMAALEQRILVEPPREVSVIGIRALQPGMVFAADVLSVNGTLLVARGSEVSEHLRTRLINMSENGALGGPLRVFLPPH